MTDETKKLFNAPWEVCLEKRGSFYRPCVVTSDTKIASVCTKENANRLARLPELYDALVPHLSATCIRCRRRECDFDFETFVQNEGCGCCDDGIFREHWKLLKKVRDGE